MEKKATKLWRYITITAVSCLLITVFAIAYGSTISNEMHRMSDTPVSYRVFDEAQ